ncbi:MAG: DUF4132 domain-containing protein [Leptolyngbya sp. SIOISBB]|nr:DUF4132 domain-containing protein [Leptolyngbya sp. SIOISBB]
MHDLHWELARNPSTPPDIIEELAQHKVLYVREMARKQSRDRALQSIAEPTISEEKLKSLLKHRDINVRVAVAKTEKGFPLFLDTCLKGASAFNRFIALMHPHINETSIYKAGVSQKWTDRYAISQNPSTSAELLTQLAADEHVLVQAAAKTALQIPFETAKTEFIPPSNQESATMPASAKAVDVQETSDEVPDSLEVPRVINLTTEEQRWVTWYPRQPLPLPDAEEFDVSSCQARLAKVEKNQWDWEQAQLLIAMPQAEAHYWMAEMLADSYRPKLETDADSQPLMTVFERSLGIAAAPYSKGGKKLSPALAIPLHIVFGIGDVVIKLVEMAALPRDKALGFSRLPLYSIPYNEHKLKCTYDETYKYYGSGFDEVYRDFMRWASGLTHQVIEGFRRYIYPYLSASEIELLAEQMAPLFTQPIPDALQEPLSHFAAFLGKQDVVANEVLSWDKPNYYSHNHGVHWANPSGWPSLLFRLEDAQQVERHLRRLNFLPRTALEIRLCVATTEFNTSDIICKRIGNSQKYGIAELMSSWLAVGTAPEMAPYMLELTLASKVSKTAMQWLEDNTVCAIVGLIPAAANAGPAAAIVSKTDLVDAAKRFLVGQARKGQTGIIQAALKDFPETIVNKITQEVLQHPDLHTVEFDEKSTPSWLKTSLAALPPATATSMSSADLPLIMVGQHCLTLEQSQQILHALQLSTPDSPLACIAELKEYATPASLDNFAWALFERWLAEGGNNKEKWAMLALGLLGSDEIALKLTPLIRKWPGESQHGKAKNGLECLRAIGSDTALMQINGIARKIKYKGLQQRARECMEDIARDRQLTAEQLEDRIIPDCGLDAKGQRVFDFGPRQFNFVLGPDLKPFVCDAEGKLRTNLPKPNHKDDAELAKQAAAEWKLMKKQISDVVKLQSIRLEQAMVNERYWPLADFKTLLVQHPLMTHLVQRLIWAGYDAAGREVITFRVAEDLTLANQTDEEINLEGSSGSVETVGLVHPIYLEEACKADWGEIFSDYEIIPPFPQLHRDTYQLTFEEDHAPEIVRFVSTEVPGVALARIMEKQGWRKGALHDHGDYRVHYKYFPKADLTAIVGNYENQHTQQSSIYGDDLINACLFVVGHYPEPYQYPKPGSWDDKRMKATRVPRVGEVDALVISEVLRDLTIVASAAK